MEERDMKTPELLDEAEKLRKTNGQTITIRKKCLGCRGEIIIKKIRGQVVQVCERFVAVHNGKYVECVWRDNDAMNNPVLEEVLG